MKIVVCWALVICKASFTVVSKLFLPESIKSKQQWEKLSLQFWHGNKCSCISDSELPCSFILVANVYFVRITITLEFINYIGQQGQRCTTLQWKVVFNFERCKYNCNIYCMLRLQPIVHSVLKCRQASYCSQDRMFEWLPGHGHDMLYPGCTLKVRGAIS